MRKHCVFILIKLCMAYCLDDDPTSDSWTTPDDKCHETTKFPYPQCQCNETHVNCVNAQMINNEAILRVDHYPSVVSVTISGNNFGDLPMHVLGVSKYTQLRYLNLSANYFVQVNAAAFANMSNLISLDLSQNEMKFDEEDLNFFAHVKKLEQLHLRKAFHDAKLQMGILERMLAKAGLSRLRLLDLSYNELDRISEKFGCMFPNLEILLLAGNSLRTFHADASCYKRLKRLDLSDNYFAKLDQKFVRFCDSIPKLSVVNLQQNPFLCDEDSKDYVEWIRTRRTVVEKDSINCHCPNDSCPDDSCRIKITELNMTNITAHMARLCNSCSSNGLSSLAVIVLIIFCLID